MGQRLRNLGPPLSRQAKPQAELAVEKLVPGGEGYARLADGRSAFVPGGLPGDRLRALELTDKKSFVRVGRFELIEGGPERVSPPCAIAAACGGCDWMALSEPAQARHKAELVREALVRMGGVVLSAVPELVRAGEALGYRSRVRLHIDEAGRIGFFRPGTRALVPVPACLVVVPALNRVIDALSRWPVAKRGSLARFASAELRVAPGGERVELELEPRERTDYVEQVLSDLALALAPGVDVYATGSERPARRYELSDGAFLSVPSGAFTQVNWSVNLALVGRVVAGARSRGAASFLDLYAGVGNFSIPLARAGLSGVAVEKNALAVRALAEAAKEQGLACQALAGDVVPSVERLVRARRRFELVVLDPPRAGAKDAVSGLAALAPRAIAYVACDPVTLARDVRALRGAGFELDEVVCFDMFPQTHHVETLAWLSRKPADERVVT